MRVHRFHSPLQHWLSGLLLELAALSAFIAAMFLVVLFVAWVR